MATEKKILQVLDLLTAVPQATAEALAPKGGSHRTEMRSVIDSKNVLAVGISEKISKEKKTGDLALTFYVERKIPLKKLKGNEVIPPTVPASMSFGAAIPTDVIAIGKIHPESAINATRKPFQPGNSVGHQKAEAGTFGAVVQDAKGNFYILSNSHVLANCGKGKLGDKVLYPGKADSGVLPADLCALLHQFIPFDVQSEYGNVVDCAIAKPCDPFLPLLLAEIKGIGLPKGTIKPKRGMKIVKVGRTTGKTTSEITDVNFRTKVDYLKRGLSKVGFKDQIFCKNRYSLPGDSGSLILDQKTMKAVGLHFAGAEGGSVSNPITEVLKALNVKLVTKKIPKKK